MMVTSCVAWMRCLHRWVGLILLVPATAISGTGILLVHESLWAKKADAKSEDGYRGKKRVSETNNLFPQADAWQSRLPAFSAAIEHFREEHGHLPLREVQLRWDQAAGWVIKIKSFPVAQGRECEILWAADEARPMTPASLVSANAYRTAFGDWDWKKIIKDLHTGKIFGSTFALIWADAAGLGIMFLGLSGLLIYLKPWVTKRASSGKVALHVGTKDGGLSSPHVAPGANTRPNPDVLPGLADS